MCATQFFKFEMAALEPVLDQDEKFLDRLGELEWIDDVTAYKCTRCQKILVQHYIANCEHKFCNNCKRLVDDGSQRWRCPRCTEFIKEIGRQDFEFRDNVHELKLHCPNRKYGCKHICPYKQLKEHLEGCEHTRESILPVLYKGEPMPDMLVELHELRWEMKEMKEKMMEMEKMCRVRQVDEEQKGVSESVWELSMQVNEMKKVMEEMQKKQKEGKWKLRVKLSHVNDRVDGVKSDLHVETIRLTNNIKELQGQAIKNNSTAVADVSLVVEENKAKILKLEGKTDAYNEMIEFNNKKNNDLMQQLKRELESQLETKQIETMKEIKSLEQTIDERTKKTTAERDKRTMEMIETLNEKLYNKMEIDTKFKNLADEIMAFEIAHKKENSEKITRKINKIKGDIHTNNIQMMEKIEVIKLEFTKKIEENKIYSDGKLNELILALSDKFEKKMKECKSGITKLEERTKQINLLIELNKSTELNNLEQNGFNLEKFIQLSFAQMNCFTLAENKDNFRPDFTWKINEIRDKVKQERFETKSEVFEWSGYPGILAQAVIYLNPYGHARMSLCLEESKRGKAIDLKLIPHVYYVLRDQTKTNNSKHRCRVKRFYFTSKFNFSLDFCSNMSLNNDFTDPPYNVDDSIMIAIYIEPPTMTQAVHSNDGTLIWAIDNYCKRKEMADEELVEDYESPYYYTGPKGYRVQVRMRLNCNGWLRAYICFLPGEFDDNLPLTFLHQTTITLFDRKESRHNIIKTVNKDIKVDKIYFIDLCENNAVENLIFNDTLFYKITIKSS